jgi:small-conductance mechanosensitive channel
MLIIALAWTYVVLLMALTEPTVVAGVMTFLLYCVFTLWMLIYVTGGKGRQARRLRALERERADGEASGPAAPD